MKNDLSVDIGMVQGIMQQSGFSSKANAKENPHESFDAIFENSFQKSEEQRNFINSQKNDRDQEPRVDTREDSRESREVSERQDKPATRDSESDYETEENVQETTPTASETENSNNSEETVNTSMESIQDEIELDKKQLIALSNLLGVTLEELSQMKIKVVKGNEESIKATLPDGTKIDLGKLLGLEEGGKLLNAEEAIKKLASLLHIDEDQAESFVKKLGIKSIEISGGNAKGQNGNKNQTPFFTGKAAESQVVEDSERKITVNDKGAKLNQAVEQGKGDVKGDTAQAKSDFGAAMKETATQVQSSNTAKADPSVGIGGKATSDPITQMTQVKETVKGSTPARVFSQIVEKAQVLSLPNKTEARISLTPANLGTVDIKIIVQDAQVKGSIVVENQQVKKIVEENLNSLKTALADQGINVDEISVDINDRNTKFEQQKGTGKESDLSNHYAGDEDKQTSEQLEQETDIEEIRRAMRNKILDVTA